jgi:hypothetical protein
MNFFGGMFFGGDFFSAVVEAVKDVFVEIRTFATSFTQHRRLS